MIELNPDARSDRRELDEERAAGRVRGPLHGIPILLKDNIDTADRMTDDGRLAGARGIDAVARRVPSVRAAARGRRRHPRQDQPERVGELPRPTARPAAGAARGGQTPQPLRARPQPVRLELRLRRRDGGELLRRPRSAPRPTARSSARRRHCGLVGIKPTVGLVSRAGIIPISHSQDTAGPMARTVADAAAVLAVLPASDPRDPATPSAARRRRPTTATFLDADGAARARVSASRGSSSASTRRDRLILEEAHRGHARRRAP